MRHFFAVCVVGLLPAAATAGIIETIEAPGVQTTSVSPVTTETFNGFSTGLYGTLSTTVGTFTSVPNGMAIVGANLFGGAGGTGNYFAIGAQSQGLSANLALDTGTDQTYFGFWLSALDPGNGFQFYENSTLVGSFSAADVKTFINAQPNASQYYGNPNAAFLHQDPNEPFAYLNFFGTGGTVFNKVVFTNVSSGSGFELDNVSISNDPNIPVTGTVVGVPLRSAGWGLLGLLASFAGWRFVRRAEPMAS